MSKQLLIEYLTFQPSPQALMESKMNPNANLLVQGKLQAKGVPNANHLLSDDNAKTSPV